MSSYRQIFKSSAIIGGSQLVNILVGIVRTKFLALLLGPSGMGLAGLYMSTTALIGTVTGLGLSNSGVRQIAEASATNDQKRISRTVAVLRRVAVASGLLGMFIVVCFRRPLSRATFGDTAHARAIGLVSLTLFFGSISGGQIALLQGLRRLRHLAASQALGAIFGAAASVLLIYFLGQDGVAPYLVAISAFGLASNWWFARRLRMATTQHLSFREFLNEAKPLLSMGTAFVISALLASAVAYLSRVFITRRLGLESVGLFQATWTLSTIYVGLVLNAMGADFYPRLTEAAHDNATVNRMVNEQTEMGLLIAVPGLLITLTFAPWVLKLFYSAQFLPAVDIIRWQIVGILLRVVSWPLGFVQLAKGKAMLFVLTESAFNLGQILLLFLCVNTWKLEGIGIGFALSYVSYTVLMLLVCKQLSDFVWSRACVAVFAAAFAALLTVALGLRLLPGAIGYVIAAGLSAASSAISWRALQRLLNINLLGAAIRRLRFASLTLTNEKP